MTDGGISGVPEFTVSEFAPKRSEYCLLIPIFNEKGRVEPELERARAAAVGDLCDIIILDGGSVDGSADKDALHSLGVNALLVKTGAGRQGAQLRMGFHYALRRGYAGFVTIDGNNKDSVEDVPLFLEKLRDGYDFVQGSRFLPGGKAENTPIMRYLALRLFHAPLISRAAGFRYTDTTNAFRGYSKRCLTHPEMSVFRDVFSGYELLAYVSVRAPRLGLKVTEVPVARSYPKKGAVPTKISPVRGNAELLKILFNAVSGKYNP